MTMAKVVNLLLAGCAAALLSTGVASAANPSKEEMGRAVKLPETAADHAALAKTYDEKAAEYTQDADYHRKMAALYKTSNEKDAATMRKHCAAIAKDDDKLANESKTMADYHRLRAKEMQ
jgi:hypothetical protein